MKPSTLKRFLENVSTEGEKELIILYAEEKQIREA